MVITIEVNGDRCHMPEVNCFRMLSDALGYVQDRISFGHTLATDITIHEINPLTYAVKEYGYYLEVS